MLTKGNTNTYYGGHLFLQKIYYGLKLNETCKNISKKYKFEFDLNNILSTLIFNRIIYPESKKLTCERAKNMLDYKEFDLHQVFRSLDFLQKETDYIQEQVYQNSKNIIDRNNNVLYYDCTNFFFETDVEDELRTYGKSKENRPNPIVQMGLFMDGNGLPLAFSIFQGKRNEQITLRPIEQRIIEDFKLKQFVVCTDAGLSSIANKKFNSLPGRKYITTQSIKKLPIEYKDEYLKRDGWYIIGSDNDKKKYCLDDMQQILENTKNSETRNKIMNLVFYKDKKFKQGDLNQRIIITFSFKYAMRQKHKRYERIENAEKLIEVNKNKDLKLGDKGVKRYIKSMNTTSYGEVAEETVLYLDYETINKDSQYDGFYATTTNLLDSATDIVKANKRRWEIEESFRIMKSEFKSRPVFLAKEDRIKAHFLTCYLSLLIYRILEKKLDERYTTSGIITTLKKFNFLHKPGYGYIPSYTRTDLTDDLHKFAKFRTDYEIISENNMKEIFKKSKSK